MCRPKEPSRNFDVTSISNGRAESQKYKVGAQNTQLNSNFLRLLDFVFFLLHHAFFCT